MGLGGERKGSVKHKLRMIDGDIRRLREKEYFVFNSNCPMFGLLLPCVGNQVDLLCVLAMKHLKNKLCAILPDQV